MDCGGARHTLTQAHVISARRRIARRMSGLMGTTTCLPCTYHQFSSVQFISRQRNRAHQQGAPFGTPQSHYAPCTKYTVLCTKSCYLVSPAGRERSSGAGGSRARGRLPCSETRNRKRSIRWAIDVLILYRGQLCGVWSGLCTLPLECVDSSLNTTHSTKMQLPTYSKHSILSTVIAYRVFTPSYYF